MDRLDAPLCMRLGCKHSAEMAAKDAEIARLREAVTCQRNAIAEYYRYWTGGETRGSYDGKPERAGLWDAMWKTAAALEPKP